MEYFGDRDISACSQFCRQQYSALVHSPTDMCSVLHLQYFGLLSSFFQSQQLSVY